MRLRVRPATESTHPDHRRETFLHTFKTSPAGGLLALTEGERRVTDLVTQLGTAQSTVSGHLACLKDCGLVIDRPQGRAVYYRVASPEVYELLVAAERLLARTGTAIDLCPNYRSNQATPTPAKEPA